MNNEPDLTASVVPLTRPRFAAGSFASRALARARTNDAALALGLLLVGLMTRLIAMPASLWEWDDILFARAMHRFNLVAHSPHPPGFPVFVMLARAAYWVLGSEHRALVTVAFIFGTLLLPALFYFYREVFRDRAVAVAGALLTGFAPNIWVQGAMGRSDGPGLTLGVIALALALRGMHSRRALLIGCAVFGLGMGVRVTLLPIVAPMLTVVLLARLRKRDWKLVTGAVAIIVAAALCWYVPMVLHTTWRIYRWVINQHAEFTYTTDSIFAPTENAVLSYRRGRFFGDIWGTAWIMWTIYSLGVLGLAALAWFRRWRDIGWMALAFVPFIIFTFVLNTPLSAPLYSLPYIPFFTGLAAAGLVLGSRAVGEMISRPRLDRAGMVLAVGLTIALAEWTYPMIKMVHREISPSVRAIQQVQSQLDPQHDAVVYDGLFSPHKDFFLKKQRAFMRQEELMPESNLIGLTVDWPRIIGLTVDPLMGAEAQQHFAWVNRRGARRLHTLSLGRYFDVYVADLTKTRGVQFLSGWYGEETGGGRPFRWMSRRGKVALLVGAETMALRLRCSAVARPGSDRLPQMVLRLDGVEVERFTPPAREFDHTVTLKTDPARLWSALEIETDVTVVPSRDANIPDDRELGLQCYALEWSPAAGASLVQRKPDAFLGAGWYGYEGDGNDVWRWTNATAVAQLPPIAGDAQLNLSLLVPENHDGRRSEVTVEVAGQVLERFQPPRGWFKKNYKVPVAAHRGMPVELKLSAQPVIGGADMRPLSIQVYYLGWQPAAAP